MMLIIFWAVSRSRLSCLDEAYYEFAQDFAARRGVDVFAFPGLRARKDAMLWCCERFPKCTDWPERGSGTGLRPPN